MITKSKEAPPWLGRTVKFLKFILPRLAKTALFGVVDIKYYKIFNMYCVTNTLVFDKEDVSFNNVVVSEQLIYTFLSLKKITMK